MPLFDLLERMVENGRRTAEKMYGCRGFVAHHNTDIHGDTAPQDTWYPATYWVMGAAWLCTHLWTHYEYTLDREFLERSYPIMCEAALFFIDFLVEKDGYLVTCPSLSPENTYCLPNGEMGAVSYGATMDNQILRDLFSQCLAAGKFYRQRIQLFWRRRNMCFKSCYQQESVATEESWSGWKSMRSANPDTGIFHIYMDCIHRNRLRWIIHQSLPKQQEKH